MGVMPERQVARVVIQDTGNAKVQCEVPGERAAPNATGANSAIASQGRPLASVAGLI